MKTTEEKAQSFDDALERAKSVIEQNPLMEYLKKRIEYIFPELKESEDEKIRKALITKFTKEINDGAKYEIHNIPVESILTWLEKQGKQNPNPYSGTAFEYNGHTFGICARDNGVEILFDGELKAFVSLEKSFIYPIHPQQDLAHKSALEAIKEEKVDNANKVEPKFKVGDEIKKIDEEPLIITKIDEKGYWSEDLFICDFDEECIWDLVRQNAYQTYLDGSVCEGEFYVEITTQKGE